jgi:hypothetical protein
MASPATFSFVGLRQLRRELEGGYQLFFTLLPALLPL